MKILKNAKLLSKKEQQSINGGRRACDARGHCGRGKCCYHGACYPIGSVICDAEQGPTIGDF